ncbi:MAG: peptide-binding protein [Candidatus Wallbacteria bacterium]|nr:peptide-binding protein [Candidatus Wallbacteria bacterium]
MKRLLCILLLLFLCQGCGSGQKAVIEPVKEPAKTIPKPPKYGGTLVAGSIKEPVTLNPLLYMDDASDTVIRLIFNGLLRYNNNWELEKDLAESYQISEDGLKISFNLKKGVKWHDNQALTADDVVFTYQEMCKGPYPFTDQYSVIDKVEKFSEHQLTFFFKRKYAAMLDLFTLRIIPSHLLLGKDLKTSSFNQSPIGTGPFQFVSWEPGEMLHLIANPLYFKGRPYLDRFVYQVIPDSTILFFELMQGKIDVMPLRAEQYYTNWGSDKQQAAISKYAFDSAAFSLLGFNLKHPLFASKNVRTALNYAINRNQIIEGVLLGMGEEASGPFTRRHWAYNSELKPYPYSLEMAEKLLADEGFAKNSDGLLARKGEVFNFTLIINRGDHERELVALMVRDNLRKLGIRVNIRSLDWNDVVSNILPQKNYDMILIALAPNPDPDDVAAAFYSASERGSFNFFGYSNPEMDKLLDQGRISLDKTERIRIYAQMQKILQEDLPVLFLYHPKVLYGINGRVRNIDPGPGDFFYNIEKWSLDQARD